MRVYRMHVLFFFCCATYIMDTIRCMSEHQGRRETGRAPGLGLSWGPTVEGCKTFFGLRP